MFSLSIRVSFSFCSSNGSGLVASSDYGGLHFLAWLQVVGESHSSSATQKDEVFFDGSSAHMIAHFSSMSFETGKCGSPDIRCFVYQYPLITGRVFKFSHTLTDLHFKVVCLTLFKNLLQRPQLYLTPSWARELVFSSQETD